MKLKLHTIGSLALAAVFASACSDYLKEDSGDLLIPEKVSRNQNSRRFSIRGIRPRNVAGD